MEYSVLTKKYLKCCWWLTLIIVFHIQSAAQPSGYFRDPLDIPIKLAANFGEIRPDHFHTGFDIRTNEKTGYKVFAAADGYVSRIKVSAGGFGKVLYISHPNGYMTVYAHLDGFNDAISAYVKQQQYAKESFEVELFPEAGKFPVKQSDWIAISGNSGASGGPHLHFEIRDASGESYPLNPASFFKLTDTIAPKFSAVYLYPIHKTVGDGLKYPVKKSKPDNILVTDSMIINSAVFGVGADVKDYMNAATNDYGIYELTLMVDGKKVYDVKFDRLDFSNGRYANAFIDYKAKKNNGAIIQRLFRLPGDRNTIYHDLVNDGKITLSDTDFHKIMIAATDANGNHSEIQFYVKHSGLELNQAITTGTVFKYDQPNSFSSDSIKVNLPANSLYEDLNLQYAVSHNNSAGRFSATCSVHNPNTPLHTSYDIGLLPRFIPSALKSKAVIVYDDGKGNRSSKTSHWEGNWLAAKARDFGNFYVMLDTVAPNISAGSIKQNQLLVGNSLKFTITDNLSGIVSYKGMLDGKWILMEYDPKNNRLSCDLEKNIAAGEHTLNVTVTDDVKNERIFTLKFRK